MVDACGRFMVADARLAGCRDLGIGRAAFYCDSSPLFAKKIAHNGEDRDFQSE
jgi:hypothetical protein